MESKDIKFDCYHFRGTVPCKPNKLKNVTCPACTEYVAVNKKILIIKLGALGDVIRTTPLLVKLKSLYPDSHFTWLTLSPDILPQDEIEVIYKLDATAYFNISHQEYDIAINLDKEEEACKLLSVVEAIEKYGFTWKDNHIACATPAAEHKFLTGLFDQLSQQNTKSYLEEIFEICHLKFNKEPYLIPLDAELNQKWQSAFSKKTSKKIVGLNSGCGPRWNTRLWPDAYWEKLANLLIKAGHYPVFLGGELEHEKNTRLSELTGAYYPGHFSLKEFIALTANVDLVLTQVSMMMHIATALQKKLVLMNNIFNKNEFELYGRGEIIGPPGECICFYGNTCKKGESSCMHEITPEAVFESIVKHL